MAEYLAARPRLSGYAAGGEIPPAALFQAIFFNPTLHSLLQSSICITM
jgi:hypothetical protein